VLEKKRERKSGVVLPKDKINKIDSNPNILYMPLNSLILSLVFKFSSFL
jgi:hypothetical protein